LLGFGFDFNIDLRSCSFFELWSEVSEIEQASETSSENT